jgi:hypothetical protein
MNSPSVGHGPWLSGRGKGGTGYSWMAGLRHRRWRDTKLDSPAEHHRELMTDYGISQDGGRRNGNLYRSVCIRSKSRMSQAAPRGIDEDLSSLIYIVNTDRTVLLHQDSSALWGEIVGIFV